MPHHSDAARPRIAVVGSYNVGLTISTPRLPVLGETLSGRGFSQGPGGKGSNQAIAAARLGADVHFVGAVADDPFGRDALALWVDEGIETSRVKEMKGSHTGVGLIMVCEEGRNAILVALGANLELTPEDVEAAREIIAQATVLITVLEIPSQTARRAVEIAREHGVRTIWNPAPARALPQRYLAGVDLLTPNETEARILAGVPPDAAVDLVELARGFIERGVGTVVLTRGAQGATIVSPSGITRVPAPHVEPVDTTGAGDAFNGALAVALAEGKSIEEAVKYACYAGAFCVTRCEVTPGLARRDELEVFMEERR